MPVASRNAACVREPADIEPGVNGCLGHTGEVDPRGDVLHADVDVGIVVHAMFEVAAQRAGAYAAGGSNAPAAARSRKGAWRRARGNRRRRRSRARDAGRSRRSNRRAAAPAARRAARRRRPQAPHPAPRSRSTSISRNAGSAPAAGSAASATPSSRTVPPPRTNRRHGSASRTSFARITPRMGRGGRRSSHTTRCRSSRGSVSRCWRCRCGQVRADFEDRVALGQRPVGRQAREDRRRHAPRAGAELQDLPAVAENLRALPRHAAAEEIGDLRRRHEIPARAELDAAGAVVPEPRRIERELHELLERDPASRRAHPRANQRARRPRVRLFFRRERRSHTIQRPHARSCRQRHRACRAPCGQGRADHRRRTPRRRRHRACPARGRRQRGPALPQLRRGSGRPGARARCRQARLRGARPMRPAGRRGDRAAGSHRRDGLRRPRHPGQQRLLLLSDAARATSTSRTGTT